MSKVNCESVCMAAMAIADGYQSDLSPDQIRVHLTDCSDCRREVEQLGMLSSLLDAQVRRQSTESIWPQVEQQLPNTVSPARRTTDPKRYFVMLGVLLLTYRIVEMVPERSLGFLFKLVPILLVIATFGLLRENPFKINTNLRLEGE